MHILFRWIRRISMALLLLFLIAVGGVFIFTQTGTFNSIILAKLTPYLATTFRGSIRIGAIEGSIWSEVVLREVTLNYRGAEVVRVPRVTLDASVVPLLWRAVHLDIAIDTPIAEVVRDSDGNWNLLEALREQHPSATQSAARWTIALDRITVHNGAIEVRPAHDSAFYRLARLATEMSVELKSTTQVQVQSFETVIGAPGLPSIQVNSQLAFRQDRQAIDLRLAQLRFRTSDSDLSLTGALKRQQLTHLDLNMSIAKFAAADLNRFLPQLRLKPDISGTAHAEGPLDTLKAHLALAAAGATLDGIGQFDLAANSPIFSATLKLMGANLNQLVDQKNLGGIFDADLEVAGKGFSLAQISAKGNLTGNNLAVNKSSLGKLLLTADSSGTKLHTNGKLAGPAGEVALDGVASLAAVKSYRLKLSSQRLDLAKMPISGMVATNLNLDASVDGNGLGLSTMDARVVAKVRNSSIAGAAVSRGDLDVRIIRGQAQIARANFDVAGAALNLHGVAAFQSDENSQLEYRVSSTNVAQLLKLARVNGNGSFELRGTLSGPSAHLRSVGTMKLQAFQTGDYRLQTGDLRYDLVAIGHAAVTGSIAGHLSEVRAGVNLRSLNFQIKTAKAPPGPLSLTLDARDDKGTHDYLALDLSYRPERMSGHLRQAVLGLPDGTWRLAAPVNFEATRQSVTLSRFELQNGKRALLMDGTLGLAGKQDFHLTLSDLDLAILGAVRKSNPVDGAVSAEVRIKGTAAAPKINTNITIARIVANGQRVGDLSASIAYSKDEATLDAALREDRANMITAAGAIPVNISWAQGVKLREAGPLNVRVTSAHLDLARLALLAPRDVRKFQGIGSIDLRIGGSIFKPILIGSLRVAGIKGEIVPLGVTISEAHARVDLSPDQIRITNFTAISGNGSITASGALGMHDYSPGAVQLTIKFDQWPTIATHEYNAVLGGQLEASGSVDNPRIAGNLDVLSGVIRPDLAFLTASSQLAPDETIKVIQPGEAAPAPSANQNQNLSNTPAPSRFNNLMMNVAVRIHRNTWIRHDQANAELEGRLQITKQAKGPIRIVGEIHTVRGWIIYDQRRFDLQSGTITFQGGVKIDPALDIDARYTLPDYLVDIIVGGTASAPTLQLRSQPSLAQSDILSLIIFGKTTSALGQGEQQTLQQRAMQMAGGYAAGQVGQAVAQSLGLEDLGVQLSGVSTTGGALGFGRYIGSNTYVSASEDVGGTQGRKVSLQYFFLRWLSITTSTSSNGGSEMDLNLTKQY